ncbi:MAG: hypothetical protein ABFD50_08475 [Smithella sp.]
MNKRLLIFLLSVVLLLVAAHLISNQSSPEFHQEFDFNAEGNVPTWFSTILLFCIASNSFRIYQADSGDQNKVRINQLFWGVMSAAFLFLSLDEGAQLHEIFENQHRIKWIFVYAPFVILFIFLTYYYLYCENCDRSFRRWLSWGLVLYISGTFLFEFTSYLPSPLSPVMQETEYVIEESLEMVGVIVILTGTQQYLQKQGESSS